MSEHTKAAEKLAQLAELAGTDEKAFKELAEFVAPICADNVDDFTEILKNISKYNEEVAQQLAAIICRVADRVREIVAAYMSIINKYPNKHVLHLAKHGKGRVRKKNIKRIREWVERLPLNAQNKPVKRLRR